MGILPGSLAGPALLGLALLALPAAGADRVFENLRGYTWTADGLRRFEALRISSAGRVVATGKSETIGQGDGIRHIDGEGATLLPGLIDAHGHVLDLGRTALQVDLSDASSLKDALRRVEAFAAAHDDAFWILGRGWNQELWPSRVFPLASDLDAVINDRPVFLTPRRRPCRLGQHACHPAGRRECANARAGRRRHIADG